MTQSAHDLIVIGAGINGAGVARDAALRGLRVLLLDKGDVGGGTTSWSTRLVHGGLRYLEHAEVGLVRESLHERETLLRIAGHLVHPLSFFIPIYDGDKRGRLTVRAGMAAYDALSFDRSEPGSLMFNAAQALTREPGLEREGLQGAAMYYDAQAEFPERLAVENAIDAAARGASVRTYARVDRLVVEDGAVRGVTWLDALDGSRGEARAPVVVNVAGPWVDEVLGDSGRTLDRMIGGTKGSHIVVAPFDGAPGEALYVEAGDGRPYFIVPWNELLLIGTTDAFYEGDLDHVVADDEEIDYLIAETNRVVPGAALTRDDVLYTYAGVRPLPYEPDVKASDVTRGHIVNDHAPELEGLISIVGGKLTTYRNLAQDAVDMVERKLGRLPTPCRTADERLPGGAFDDVAALRSELAGRSGVGERVARRLARLYGSRAHEVLELVEGDPTLGETIDETTGALAAEVPFAVERELARRLPDVLMRRTMVGLGPTVGLGPDEAAAEVARRVLGWDAERVQREVAAHREEVRDMRPRAAAA